MTYGYARCSTNESKQDIYWQVNELKRMGVAEENIYLEYQSGAAVNRNQLQLLMNNLKRGDTVISTEVSRITRSAQQQCSILEIAKAKSLCFIFGTFKVDCTKELDPMTEGMLKMMGVFAELERNMISQRVKSGIANAKDNGKRIGRKPTDRETIPDIFYKHYPIYMQGMITKAELARLCGLSYPTVYKYIAIVSAK